MGKSAKSWHRRYVKICESCGIPMFMLVAIIESEELERLVDLMQRKSDWMKRAIYINLNNVGSQT